MLSIFLSDKSKIKALMKLYECRWTIKISIHQGDDKVWIRNLIFQEKFYALKAFASECFLWRLSAAHNNSRLFTFVNIADALVVLIQSSPCSLKQYKSSIVCRLQNQISLRLLAQTAKIYYHSDASRGLLLNNDYHKLFMYYSIGSNLLLCNMECFLINFNFAFTVSAIL